MIVSIIWNISPLLTAVFSYFLYRVNLSRLDLCILLISFIGVMILIYGTIKPGIGDDNNVEEYKSQYSKTDLIIPTICLIIIPFNSVCNRLFLRSMRNISELTLSCYTVSFMFLIYFPIVVIFYDFDFLNNFLPLDWMICVILGLSNSNS